MKAELKYFEELIQESKKIKNLNREISKARRAFNHDHCFLPLSKIYEIFGINNTLNFTLNNTIDDTINYNLKNPNDLKKMHDSVKMMNQSQAWLWSYSKEVYRVNPIVYNAFTKTDIDEIMWDQFYKLPSFCLYLDLSDCCDSLTSNEIVRGAFISINDDEAFEEKTFRIQVVCLNISTTEYRLVSVPLYMDQNNLTKSFDKFIETTYQVAKIENPKIKSFIEDQFHSIRRVLKNILQIVLFILNEQKDVVTKDKDRVYKLIYKQESPNSWILPQKHKPTVFKVGFETAYKMKRSIEEAETLSSCGLRTVSPHFRRAHWHGYWVNKTLKYRWMPPMFIGIKKDYKA